MITLILKLTHNVRFKDTVAIGRGLYRVSEGFTPVARKPKVSSWIDDPYE